MGAGMGEWSYRLSHSSITRRISTSIRISDIIGLKISTGRNRKPSAAETACLRSSPKNESGLKNRRLNVYQQPHTINFMLATLLTVWCLPQIFHSGVFE
jgi:hypothetical protein